MRSHCKFDSCSELVRASSRKCVDHFPLSQTFFSGCMDLRLEQCITARAEFFYIYIEVNTDQVRLNVKYLGCFL